MSDFELLLFFWKKARNRKLPANCRSFYRREARYYFKRLLNKSGFNVARIRHELRRRFRAKKK